MRRILGRLPQALGGDSRPWETGFARWATGGSAPWAPVFREPPDGCGFRPGGPTGGSAPWTPESCGPTEGCAAWGPERGEVPVMLGVGGGGLGGRLRWGETGLGF